MAKKEFYLFNFLLITMCLTYKEMFSIIFLMPFIYFLININKINEEFFELSYLFLNGILFSYLFLFGITILNENIAIVFIVAILYWVSLNAFIYLLYRIFNSLKNLYLKIK